MPLQSESTLLVMTATVCIRARPVPRGVSCLVWCLVCLVSFSLNATPHCALRKAAIRCPDMCATATETNSNQTKKAFSRQSKILSRRLVLSSEDATRYSIMNALSASNPLPPPSRGHASLAPRSRLDPAGRPPKSPKLFATPTTSTRAARRRSYRRPYAQAAAPCPAIGGAAARGRRGAPRCAPSRPRGCDAAE